MQTHNIYRYFCVPAMRSDVSRRLHVGLLNRAGLQANFRHFGASQMAFVLLRCGRVMLADRALNDLFLNCMC